MAKRNPLNHSLYVFRSLLPVIILTLAPSQSSAKDCRGTKKYKIVYEISWNRFSDRKYPGEDKAYICIPVVVSHNKDFELFSDGKKVSNGVADLVKFCKMKKLEDELKELTKASVRDWFLGKEKDPRMQGWNDRAINIFDTKLNGAYKLRNVSLGNLSVRRYGVAIEWDRYGQSVNIYDIAVSGDRKRFYISAMAKIGPAPDWFIGVSGVNMCDQKTRNWNGETSFRGVEVRALDAGVREGNEYKDEEKKTEPRESVKRVNVSGVKDVVYLESLVITKKSELPVWAIILIFIGVKMLCFLLCAIVRGCDD